MRVVQDFVGNHPTFAIATICVLLVGAVTVILGLRPLRSDPADLINRLRTADAETQRRVWDHSMHEDSVFNDRQNFFLVFESVLVGSIGGFFTKTGPNVRIVRFIALFGLAVTLLWLYVQVRQHYITKLLKKRNKAVFDDYASAISIRRRWPFHAYTLLAYAFPLLVALAWIVVLGFLEGWYFGL